MSTPHPEGRGAQDAMRAALRANRACGTLAMSMRMAPPRRPTTAPRPRRWSAFSARTVSPCHPPKASRAIRSVPPASSRLSSRRRRSSVRHCRNSQPGHARSAACGGPGHAGSRSRGFSPCDEQQLRIWRQQLHAGLQRWSLIVKHAVLPSACGRRHGAGACVAGELRRVAAGQPAIDGPRWQLAQRRRMLPAPSAAAPARPCA
jgi:hypothetical protein